MGFTKVTNYIIGAINIIISTIVKSFKPPKPNKLSDRLYYRRRKPFTIHEKFAQNRANKHGKQITWIHPYKNY